MFELTKEFLESHEALITVQVADEAVAEGMKKAAHHISMEANIPGFRKGKAPYSLVLQMFGDSAVRQEAAEVILDEIYPQVIEQAEIDPYSQGQLEDLTLSPMTFKIRVPLQPTIVLGDYETLRKPFDAVEVTEQELAAALDHVRNQNAVVQPVDRPAKLGDEVSFESIHGEAKDEVFFHDHEVKIALDADQHSVVPGFSEAIVGLSKGEQKQFTLTLPDDFEDEDLQGEEATFTVEVNAVSERTLPDLDDALASTVGPFATLEAMKTDLHKQMLDYKEAEAQDAYRTAVLAELTQRAEIKYPTVMEEERLDALVEQAKQNIKRRYNLEWSDFLRLQGKTEEQVREELRPEAIKSIKEGLVLSEFAILTNVVVTDEEVKAELKELLKGANITDFSALERFDPKSNLAVDLRLNLITKKAIDKMARLAQGLPMEEVSPEAGETAASDPAA